MKIILSIFLAVFISGCAPKSSVDSYKVVNKFTNEEYLVNTKWHEGYNEENLNKFINLGLNSNADLKILSLNIFESLAKTGLLEANLYPTMSSSYGLESGRDISLSENFRHNYRANVMVSYELDLYGKIKDSINSAKWKSVVSWYDLESAKLSLINSITDSYFKALFINDALKLLDENLKNYKRLYFITKAKLDLGKEVPINLLELNKTILNLESKILSYKKEKEINYEFLRNLLHLKPNDSLNLDNLSLYNVKFQGIDMSVPSYAISNRPDLRKYISSINSAFYEYKISQKDFYPTLNLGASLSSSSSDFKGSSELDFLSGSIKINLPFLDYKRLKENLKIKEIEFEKRVVEYEKNLLKALNEVNLYYKEYEISLQNLNLYENILNNSKKLSEIYLFRYEYGNSELKNYLEAKNSEISARINLLNEKYKALNSEILIYKSMAGKFKK